MAADPPRVYYRLVRANPPSLGDFMSYAAHGITPRRPLTARQHDQWRGVSLYFTRAAAVLRARLSPQLGAYIAEIRVPSVTSVRIEQGGRDPDHFNAWGEPSQLLG